MSNDADSRSLLLHVLHAAQARGFLGRGEIGPQVAHATDFALAAAEPDRAVDLGSGGGLPALVLALTWSRTHWLLVEASARRAAFLLDAVHRLHLQDRVEVIPRRVEEMAQEPPYRQWADVVTARGFGVPPLTAENAAPLVREGGRLVVSEPPALVEDRWPAAGLAAVGLHPLATWRGSGHYRVLVKAAATPDLYPRRPKAQQRSPLWGAPGKRTA